MQFWLCRSKLGMYDGRYDFTNYCPYRSRDDDTLECLYFWYPHWLGGSGFTINPTRLDSEWANSLEEIPPGSCKNLVTGQIVRYEDLLPIEVYHSKKYYSWGVK